ncbi:MAG: PKD domain-containing protein, partial [Bacteroidia bacterium]|nr:PKD domain-containing protein [Bacteroidia bacterium]
MPNLTLAQVFTIGSGTTSNTNVTYPAPYGNNFMGARHQFLYRASELTAAGMTQGLITAVGFNVTNVNGSGPFNNFTIKLKNTTTNALTAWETGLTTVLNPITYTPVVGANDHILNTPFCWDGTSNIVVEVCFNNTTFGLNASTEMTTGVPGGVTARWYANDVNNVCSSTNLTTTSTNRTNVRFTRINAPAPVASFTAPTTAIVGTTVNFTNTSTGGVSYQWDFNNDGTIDATTTNGSFVYNTVGTYTVRLVANNCGSTDDTIAVNYITITNPPNPPTANFSALPLSTTPGTNINFTDNSTGFPSSWAWDFQNDGTYDNFTQNPTFAYGATGQYSVKLRVCNVNGCDSLVRTNYINIIAPYCSSNATSSADSRI